MASRWKPKNRRTILQLGDEGNNDNRTLKIYITYTKIGKGRKKYFEILLKIHKIFYLK